MFIGITQVHLRSWIKLIQRLKLIYQLQEQAVVHVSNNYENIFSENAKILHHATGILLL